MQGSDRHEDQNNHKTWPAEWRRPSLVGTGEAPCRSRPPCAAPRPSRAAFLPPPLPAITLHCGPFLKSRLAFDVAVCACPCCTQVSRREWGVVLAPPPAFETQVESAIHETVLAFAALVPHPGRGVPNSFWCWLLSVPAAVLAVRRRPSEAAEMACCRTVHLHHCWAHHP